MVARFSSCVDNIIGVDQPEPLKFSYRNTVRESFPSLLDEELDMLLKFLDSMLQIDPDRRSTAPDLLRNPWLLNENGI